MHCLQSRQRTDTKCLHSILKITCDNIFRFVSFLLFRIAVTKVVRGCWHCSANMWSVLFTIFSSTRGL